MFEVGNSGDSGNESINPNERRDAPDYDAPRRSSSSCQILFDNNRYLLHLQALRTLLFVDVGDCFALMSEKTV